MSSAEPFEIFLVASPGLEATLGEEVRRLGFPAPTVVEGGVVILGGWPDVWRANLEVRGASRILARIAAFRAMHLAQLDKRSRAVAWGEVLRRDVPVRVEASCKRSRIYHAGAATQRIETALRETFGATISADAEVRVMARIEDDLCTISVDTSGEMLHKRGHKEAIAKAPMRETMASLLLRQCGFAGTETVLDPMCGSGTFVIEAAEIAAGLKPGRSRDFAFEQLATYDAAAWQSLRAGAATSTAPTLRFYGSDRDAGAIRMSRANAERAGVGAFTAFDERPVGDLAPPDGPSGLVIINPPYGTRISDKRSLFPLYATLGQRLRHFSGWRVGIITTEASLAKATGLPFLPPGPSILHGGLRVTLFQTGVLK
jgi:putative N6-adenine-specific DNA methylase